MKNKLQILIISLVAVLLFTACGNDDSTQSGIISGTLTPGENVTLGDLKGALLVLNKLDSGIDPSSVTTETEEMEIVDTTRVAADGSFSFAGLDYGNYVLSFEDEFLFDADTFSVVTVDGKSEYQFNAVARYIADNAYVIPEEGYTKYTLKTINNTGIGSYSVIFYAGGESPQEVVAPGSADWNLKVCFPDNADLSIKLKFGSSSGEVLSPELGFPTIFSGKSNCNVTVDGKTLHLSTYYLFGRKIKIED